MEFSGFILLKILVIHLSRFGNRRVATKAGRLEGMRQPSPHFLNVIFSSSSQRVKFSQTEQSHSHSKWKTTEANKCVLCEIFAEKTIHVYYESATNMCGDTAFVFIAELIGPDNVRVIPLFIFEPINSLPIVKALIAIM